jgi:opacity protein-like surface antigen
MRLRRVIGLLTVSILSTSPAFAQAPAPARPSAPRAWTEPGTGYRVYVVFDQVSLAAEKSFDAILGKTSLSAVGGGGEIRFWKGLFVRGSYSAMEATGERAFVVGGQVIPVGIPLTVQMKPWEFSVGWRVPLDRAQRFVAYGGAGSLYVTYRETSDFAGPGENVDESFTGQLAFGGLDVRIWKLVSAGVEVQYRTVPDALGREGSVSAGYDETNLGGTAIRFMVGIRK